MSALRVAARLLVGLLLIVTAPIWLLADLAFELGLGTARQARAMIRRRLAWDLSAVVLALLALAAVTFLTCVPR